MSIIFKGVGLGIYEGVGLGEHTGEWSHMVRPALVRYGTISKVNDVG